MRKHEEREDEVTKRRRRRGGPIGERKLKLRLPDGFEPDPAFEYRWVNDDGGRIHALTKEDDWDFVSREGNKTVSTRVGTKDDGSDKIAHLVQKPKAYVEEDRAEKARAIDESEGKLRDPIGKGAEGITGENYVPSSGIKIAADK